jgi:DNA-directed RNA polymerase subunit RPC12/RpoP
MNAAGKAGPVNTDTLLVCRHCGSYQLEIRESEDGKLVYRCISCSRVMQGITPHKPRPSEKDVRGR